MSDIKTDFVKEFSGDWLLENATLAEDNGLETAVIQSLFTDRRADDDDVLPNNINDKRGWYGDGWLTQANDKLGSKLWLLARKKQLPSVINRASEYARESLQWLIDDGIASNIEVTAEILEPNTLGLSIKIYKPQGDEISFRFQNVW